jgi:hypothetical protein
MEYRAVIPGKESPPRAANEEGKIKIIPLNVPRDSPSHRTVYR